MRLLPAQIGMHLLLGHAIPGLRMRLDGPELADRIRTGRMYLIGITGRDFGYDALRWHDHLRTTGEGGYRRSKTGQSGLRGITSAMNDPKWQQAVAALEAVPHEG